MGDQDVPKGERTGASLARQAAVLVLVYALAGEPHLVLTRRTDRVATHKGEISLPGGAQDADDPSPLATALREAAEELGIEPAAVEILGELEPVETMVSNFVITPFVGWSRQRPQYRPHPAEVAEVIEVPLRALQEPDALAEEVWTIDGTPRLVAFYRYGGHRIWGATFRILRQFLARLAAGTLALPR